MRMVDFAAPGLAAQDRLKALKEHNTEEYYKLVKEHKNEKILNVLTETDKYLKALGLAVAARTLSPSRPPVQSEGGRWWAAPAPRRAMTSRLF